MPPSADTKAEIVEAILALERSCLEADTAFLERRWADVGVALGTQSALTDRLASLFEAAPELAPANEPRVRKRLLGVLAFRDDQLRRMRAYNEQVGERLRSIAKMRAYSRTIGTARVPARIVNTER